MSVRVLALSALFCLACDESAVVVAPAGPARAPIVNGTRTPQVVTLTPGQTLAIGFLAYSDGSEWCSGTLIAPNAVLTAAHCIEDEVASDVYFGVGTYPYDYEALYQVAEIIAHPTRDAALLILEEPVDGRVTPLAFNRATPPTSWEGRYTDAAGYGYTETNASGRFFAKVYVVDIERDHIHVDGQGEQGLCEGDSGGPLLFQASAADPVMIIGIEEYGDADTCTGNDWEVRTDLLAAWIDSELEGTGSVGTQPCNSATFGAPRCSGDDYVACVSDKLHVVDCSLSGRSCGQLSATTYGCLPEACGEIDFRGTCDGNFARYCANSGLREGDCTAQGNTCMLSVEGYRCGCTQCGGACVDLATSVTNCGACNRGCNIANGAAGCEDGACIVLDCNDGHADGDGDPTNGCETEVTRKKGCAAAGGAELFTIIVAGLALLAWSRARLT